MARNWPSDFGSLQQEMNEMLDRFTQRFSDPHAKAREGAWLPPVNITETTDSVTLEAELPGVDPKSIDISVTGDMLTIKGEKKREQETKGERVHRVERNYGTFTRSFQLPSAIIADKVAADFKNGVLRVTLPKSDKTREIKVPVK